MVSSYPVEVVPDFSGAVLENQVCDWYCKTTDAGVFSGEEGGVWKKS